MSEKSREYRSGTFLESDAAKAADHVLAGADEFGGPTRTLFIQRVIDQLQEQPVTGESTATWATALDARIVLDAATDPFETRAEREYDEVGKRWNALTGVRKIRILSSKRRKLLQKRLSERAWDWKAAMAKFPLGCFQDGGWTPGFDWFLKADTVNRILEGNYDWEK